MLTLILTSWIASGAAAPTDVAAPAQPAAAMAPIDAAVSAPTHAAAPPPVETSAPVPPPEEIARVVLLEGTPQARAADDAPWRPLALGDHLHVGDRLQTRAGDRLRVLMSNRSLVDLAPNSELKLSFIDGEPEHRRVGLRAFFGRLWARVAGGNGEERFEVESDNAVAGVRGTSFFMDIDPAGDTRVTVAAGSVEVGPRDTPSFTLDAFQRGVVPKHGSPRIERDVSLQQLAQMRAGTAPARKLAANGVARRFTALKQRLGAHGLHLGKGRLLRKLKSALQHGERRNGERRLPLAIDPGVARRLRERLMRLRSN